MPSTLVLMLLFSSLALAHHPKLFLQAGEAEALAWLNETAAPDGVVLSSSALGAFVPAFTSQRAVAGHAMETVNALDTELRLRVFYAATTSSDERRAALAEWGADYVLLGPRERDLGVEQLSAADGVQLVARFDQVMVYQVALP